MIPSFRKTRTDDADLRQVQDSLGLTLDQVIRRQILDGVLVTGIKLVAGLNIVNHTLLKPVSGFLIVERNANEQVWNGVSSKVNENLNIALQSSGAVTVSIWFF